MNANTAIAPLIMGPTEPVSAHNSSLTVGKISNVQWGDVASVWWPRWHTEPYTYHVFGALPTHPNPTETAFKIVAKLLEKELVTDLTVAQFVELVNDVATIVKEQ